MLQSKKVLIFCFLMVHFVSSKAQFIKGFGVTAGATFSRQKWIGTNPDFKDKLNYKPGGNTSIFMEYIDHKYYRMITELQFNMKGARDNRTLLSGYRYAADYLSVNNFFKLRQELYDVTPYVLLGPRVEFLLSSNITQMRVAHVTASGGIGMEFLYTRTWILFAEVHYNPDAMSALRITDFKIRQNAWEIRVGVKYELKKKADCPRPRGGKNF